MKRLWICVAACSVFACSSGANRAAPTQASTQEIPITSKSPEAVDHFKKGRALVENVRNGEAIDELNQALKLDPDFASAHAYLGVATTGAEGVKELELASSKAAGLPEAERILIDAFLAGRRGESAKSVALYNELASKVPNDWRVYASLGSEYAAEQKHADAIAALRKATTINPKEGTVFNSLGYESLRQGDVNGAIDAFQQYATLNPTEPNAQDSLGEALIGAGRFADAEAAYAKAAALSPRFWNAWEGTAYAKFYTGDWAGGEEALAKAKAAAALPGDKLSIDEIAGFAALASGRGAEALKRFEAMASGPAAGPRAKALSALDRATADLDAAKYRDALAQTSAAMTVVGEGKLAPVGARTIRRQALSLQIAAEAGMGDATAAAKTAATLEQDAAALPDQVDFQRSVHFARGMLAMAKKDYAGAGTHFDQCATSDSTDSYCGWQRVVAADKAKNAAAAKAAKDQVLSIYRRDPVYLYVHSKLAPKAAPKAAAKQTN